MDESDRRAEYLNRDAKKRFAAWKNMTSSSMWTAMHWEKQEKEPMIMKRPSTAPPAQFGLKYTPKTEIPAKINWLMDAVHELQSQMQHSNMNLSQQNVLIDNLTDIVERMQQKQETQNGSTEEEEEQTTADVLVLEEENTEEIEQIEKVRSMIKEAMTSPVKPQKIKSRKNSKRGEVKKGPVVVDKRIAIPTFVVADVAEIKMKKKLKPTQPKGKRKSKTRKERMNRKKNKSNKPVTPKVLKTIPMSKLQS